MQTVHNLEAFTMPYAYDYTQCSDSIKDGDILLVRDGVAIMVEAWPVMAVGISAVFHNVSHGFHAETSGKYAKSFAEANSSIDTLKAKAKQADLSFFDIDF